MARDGSVAPRDRVNITYKTEVGGASADVELPLRLLFMGDYTGKPGHGALQSREPVSVLPGNFDEVLASHKVKLELEVRDRLTDGDGVRRITLDIRRMSDFGPDAVAENVSDIRKLLGIRDALRALRGPVGEIREFRQKIEALLTDQTARHRLAAELGEGGES